MSRAYVVRVSESIKRDITAADEIRSQLELLQILPPEEMGALLRTELQAGNYKESSDGTFEKQSGDVRVTIDSCSGEVKVKAEGTRSAEAERTATATSYDDFGPGRELSEQRAKAQVMQELEKAVSAENAKLQQEMTAQLEAHLAELQPELAKIVNKVTRDALKIKATRLGRVTEVSEDEASGELTIRVDV